MVQELGREPTHEELARRVDMPAWKVRKALKIAQQPISLETPIGDDGETTIASFIEDRRSANPAETAITNNLRELTEDVLSTLTPREKEIIRRCVSASISRARNARSRKSASTSM